MLHWNTISSRSCQWVVCVLPGSIKCKEGLQENTRWKAEHSELWLHFTKRRIFITVFFVILYTGLSYDHCVGGVFSHFNLQRICVSNCPVFCGSIGSCVENLDWLTSLLHQHPQDKASRQSSNAHDKAYPSQSRCWKAYQRQGAKVQYTICRCCWVRNFSDVSVRASSLKPDALYILLPKTIGNRKGDCAWGGSGW